MGDKHLEYGAFTFSFELDGDVYTAIEDQVDGYRSCLDKIKVNEFKIDTNIPPTKVKIKYINNYDEIIEIVDKENYELILEIGTERRDKYYPCFIANYHPENLHYNK